MKPYVRAGAAALLAAVLVGGCDGWPWGGGSPSPTPGSADVTPAPGKDAPGIASDLSPSGHHGSTAVPGASGEPDTDDAGSETSGYRLMGLRPATPSHPGTEAGMVTVLHGKPDKRYPLQDGDRKLDVYAYPSFRVGITPDNRVAFVDVFDKADTGLGKIGVHSTADEVQSELGKPQSQSPYVLTYSKGGVVLKFDLDVKSGRVLSVKLFAESTP
ncbi:hypothetical protein ACFQWB_12120 [Paenibacillus thermoaerophilus]|uniref:Lipoprotein n=1 Tax=Paenibacillus thermoaerophilus TaxID=1215385 RepID=A0ABW2V7B8_9BACL|nr:hypothetical protein [Paenibacillus thermoaerophilus]TMV11979.1 hypothetical protein FE781_12310 [Paenibacillus thermoaerophilus]